MVDSPNPTPQQVERWMHRPAPRRRSEVPKEILAALSQGWIESKNLVEWLSVDRVQLAITLAHQIQLPLSQSDKKWLKTIASLSVLQQSWEIGRWMAQRLELGDPSYQCMVGHRSDVVREWSAIVVGSVPDLSFAKRLAWIKTQADDSNAGTRELAWMALRPFVLEDPDGCIARLIPWTGSRNERLRRYASEITRPCGVWCAHSPLLKCEPERGLPILKPLCSDDSVYVNNSVANWLNDASKSQPKWVRSVTSEWLRTSPTPQTQRLVKRALRTLNRTP
jgi:3-methyladenine DNA glycosylase AlkC